jgi:ankyrin repeat protein
MNVRAGTLDGDAVVYPTKRAALKAKIIKEVMDEIFPEEKEIDVTEYVGLRGEESKGNFLVEFFKFMGCMDVSIQRAVWNGSPKQLTKALQNLTKGVDPDPSRVNMRDDNGRTALSIAVKVRRSDLIEILLEYKANPNLVDLDTGMSPLMFAISTSNVGAVELFLNSGADVMHVDYQGVTPLMLACSLGDWDSAFMLLRVGADVDTVDLNGWTPLHYAAFGGNPDCCELLIEEGADRKIKNNQHRKALHIARSKGFGDVISVLEDKKSSLFADAYDD